MTELNDLVCRAVSKKLNAQVRSIRYKGLWIRQIFEAELEDNEQVIVKLDVHPEWGDSKSYVHKCHMLRQYQLPAPQILALDDSMELLPYPYVIEEKLSGERLADVLPTISEEESLSIFTALGQIYRTMHAIHHTRAGLWGETPYQPRYEVHPNDYMFRAEIVNGSGEKALKEGLITKDTYDRAVRLWQSNLDYLKDHQPCLVHNSAFWWTIGVTKTADGWAVTRLTALDDILWWDRAYDIAVLRYPPFGCVSDRQWQAFGEGYGETPEQKRVLLYSLMQRLCACMGVYMEPKAVHNQHWIAQTIVGLDDLMNSIEQLG